MYTTCIRLQVVYKGSADKKWVAAAKIDGGPSQLVCPTTRLTAGPTSCSTVCPTLLTACPTPPVYPPHCPLPAPNACPTAWSIACSSSCRRRNRPFSRTTAIGSLNNSSLSRPSP